MNWNFSLILMSIIGIPVVFVFVADVGGKFLIGNQFGNWGPFVSFWVAFGCLLSIGTVLVWHGVPRPYRNLITLGYLLLMPLVFIICFWLIVYDFVGNPI